MEIQDLEDDGDDGLEADFSALGRAGGQAGGWAGEYGCSNVLK